MTSSLAHRIQAGFGVGRRWYPWGSRLGDVPTARGFPRVLDPGAVHVELPGARLGDLSTVDAMVHAYHATRPVYLATYGLSGALVTRAGLSALRARLDEALGPGAHETVARIRGFPASGSVRAVSEWRVEAIRVSLSAYTTVRAERYGKSAGRLYLRGDDRQLALPYLRTLRASRQPWTRSAGQVERFATGASYVGEGTADSREHEIALHQPYLRRTAPWLAEVLRPGDVALWTHASGTWGVGDRQFTIAVPAGKPLALRHERCLPADGPGGAALSWVGRGPLVSTGPGPRGLDALCARLRERPEVAIELVEFPDEMRR